MDSLIHEFAEPDHALGLIRTCLSEARAIPALDAEELAALSERAEAGVFNLLAVGEFKRGKSSLLNALLGTDILPVGVIPLTAIATILSHGESPLIEVHLEQGDRRPIALAELADYVTETGNPRNVKGVREVHIRLPSPWLAQGVRLIDTPGIGSIHRHNSEVTYRYLERADAVLFLLSADQPVGQAETEFLQGVREQAGRLFFLLKAEVGQLAGETVASAVTAFADDLTQNLARDLDRRFEEIRHLPLRTLDAELQDWVVARVRESWDDFRREQDLRIDAAFQAICERFAARIEATIDELYRFSAELFALPYERSATEPVWTQESRFYYRFTSEPPMLAQLTAAFRLSLPKLLGEPWVRRRARERMRMLADRQASRVRHDFVERLEQSRQAFTSALLQRLDNALAGIDSAMRRGLALSLDGEQAAARRETELAADLDRLDRLAGRLQPLLEGSAEP